MSNRRAGNLVLIRHGETDWNTARRYQGQTDTALNESGQRQMGQVADRLSLEKLDLVLSSPLQRAVQSAEIIAAPHGLPVIPEDRLQELHLGLWQGKPYRLREANPGWFYKAPHGGEDGQLFCDRISAWLDEQPNADLTVLVTHGLVIQVILMLISGRSFDYWHSQPIKNGSITHLVFTEASWQIAAFNDDAHLTAAILDSPNLDSIS